MKKREANFELLRIAAMLMIITLHYLDKGGILPKPDQDFGITGFLAWGLEAFCVPAVNVYVLLSAYFLAEGEYRPFKAVTLWLQVLFYSVLIPAVLIGFSILSLAEMDKYKLLVYVFPVIEEHYWFVSAYVLMVLFAPLMNDGLRRLPEKTYRQGLLCLLLVLSVGKSILPVNLPTDRLGYDAVWFLYLYLIGAYIRYHGEDNIWIRRAGRMRTAFCGYAAGCTLIFASLAAVHAVFLKTGSLGAFINRQYHYNSVFCLIAAVCLFLAFRSIRIRSGRISAVICRAASASFGVYLIHEHVDMRYLWNVWLGTEAFAQTPLFLLHWLPGILLVYGVCMLIDLFRQFLFQRAGKFLRGFSWKKEK